MLPKNPDKSIVYYTITDEDENFEPDCHDGLVINPNGIIFTTKKWVHNLLHQGNWIRPVMIPKEATVITIPKTNLYSADRLFFFPRKEKDFYIKYLFDPKTFPKKAYWKLATYFPEYFDVWFDPKLYPKSQYVHLAMWFYDRFEDWYNKEIFPEKAYEALPIYCSNHFDGWFDKEKIHMYGFENLIYHCRDHISKWYDPKTFPKDLYPLLRSFNKEKPKTIL